jgi:acyl-CoA thioester hydrolase
MTTTSSPMIVRVYYEDTDSGGVVYYANYLKFAERARTEWLRSLGFEQQALWQEREVGFVVKQCQIDYHRPAYLDDLLSLSIALTAQARSTLTMRQEVYRGVQAIATLEITLVCVNRALRPTRIPEEILSALTAAQQACPPHP